MKNITLLISLIIVGCAGKSPYTLVRTVLPSGDPGYSISCTNAQSINACYELAGQICVLGYDVISKEDFASQQSSGVATQGGAVYSSSGNWQKGVLVKCNQDSLARSEERANALLQADAQRRTNKNILIWTPLIIAGAFGIAALPD